MPESIDHPKAVGALRRRPGRGLSLLKALAMLFSTAACLSWATGSARADKIKHPIAVFSGLDKITGRIITFEVATNETVQFGSLQITERVCYSRPPTEAPRTDTFVEIDNIDANNDYKRIFTGWMFAGSPSLHALDHPVYDVWLLRCKGAGQLIPTPPETAAVPPVAPDKSTAAAKPAKPKTPTKEEAQRALPPVRGAPIEVPPPPGFAAPAERRQPTRQFYPSTPAPNDGNDGF